MGVVRVVEPPAAGETLDCENELEFNTEPAEIGTSSPNNSLRNNNENNPLFEGDVVEDEGGVDPICVRKLTSPTLLGAEAAATPNDALAGINRSEYTVCLFARCVVVAEVDDAPKEVRRKLWRLFVEDDDT